MRKLFIIFCFLPILTFGQITTEDNWPISIRKEIEYLNSKKVDTVLLSYTYYGPWNNLPSSCKDINDIWIIYHKDKYFAKKVCCDYDSITVEFPISPRPIRFFVNHIKDFKTRETYFKSHSQLPPFKTDVSSDHLIFMTNNKRIAINISDDQKIDSIWGKYPWIQPSIEAIDLTKATIQKGSKKK
jgi:hypothetical protein